MFKKQIRTKISDDFVKVLSKLGFKSKLKGDDIIFYYPPKNKKLIDQLKGNHEKNMLGKNWYE